MLNPGAFRLVPGSAVSVSTVSVPQSASGTWVPGSPATGAPSASSPTTRVPAKSAFALAAVAAALTLTVTMVAVISPPKRLSPVTSALPLPVASVAKRAVAPEVTVAALTIVPSAG